MARLERLCSEDSDDALQGDNEHERREKLFRWVVEINSKLQPP